MSPLLKYSNWLVSLLLFLLATRTLLIVASYAVNPSFPRTDPTSVMIGQALGSTLILLAAGGVFEWKNWGRRLAIVMCGGNVFFGSVIAAHFSSNMKVRLYVVAVILVFVIGWFFVPRVREEFARHSAQADVL